MPEAEISPTGTVLVEGHHVGELQGFRFTADQTAGGEDAKAVRTAAQKALAAEFEARAERFGASANGDIALGSDGTLRWIGAPIGTLVSGEDALKPRLVLLADEQLTGPARDKVAARAERFVNFQIESLLKPLVDLRNADQISGIGRGIAFQLVENFGLINRRDIAEEMKSLDQEGRAALRRLGVRFGAYHVFVPALIKPAPAGLVTLLWALKNDGKDKPGFGDVVHALASGRTSVVIDPAFDKTFYKLAGYRNLGRRAVRIDILERLADLIRPATNWKPGLGQRPDGAYDGQSFMVTPPMMSILGATADDMEEILKGLGYRAEPKSAVEVKARLEAQDNAAREAAVAKLAAEEAARAEQAKAVEAATTDAAAEASVEGSEPASDTVALSEAAVEIPADIIADAAAEPAVPAVEQADAPIETAQDEAPVAEAAAEAAEPALVEPQAEAEAAAAEEAAPAELVSDAAPATDAAPEEPAAVAEAAAGEPAPEAETPKPILLWRQGRFEQRPRNRDDNRRNNRPRNGQARGRSDAPADAAGAAAATASGERPAQEGRRDGAGKARFDRSKFKPKPQTEGEQRRDGRPQGERPDRREGRPDWKGGRPDGKGGPQGGKPAFQPKPREERPVRFDPDSPFAKLAALRDQLKK